MSLIRSENFCRNKNQRREPLFFQRKFYCQAQHYTVYGAGAPLLVVLVLKAIQ